MNDELAKLTAERNELDARWTEQSNLSSRLLIRVRAAERAADAAAAERGELAAILKAILNCPDDEMRGVIVRLPFWLEAKVRAALASLSMCHTTDAANPRCRACGTSMTRRSDYHFRPDGLECAGSPPAECKQ